MNRNRWLTEAENQRTAVALEKEVIRDLLGEILMARKDGDDRRCWSEKQMLEQHFDWLNGEQSRVEKELRALLVGQALLSFTMSERERDILRQTEQARRLLHGWGEEAARGRRRRMRDRFIADALALELSRLDSERTRMREETQFATHEPIGWQQPTVSLRAVRGRDR